MSETSPYPRDIARHFVVGSLATHNVVIDGKRRFIWTRGEEDMQFADIAQWRKYLEDGESDATQASLVIPTTVRPAGSVLGGMQAWPTEKAEVVKFMSNYIQTVHNTLGGVDQAFGLNTVGVSRGNKEMLVLPPHDLQTDPEVINTWANTLRTDMTNVLAHEEQRDHLMNMLNEAIDLTMQREI